jgi:hypothetical protein
MKTIMLLVFVATSVCGCGEDSPSSYYELIVRYKGEGIGYRRSMSDDEVNFGSMCTSKFKEPGVFDACLAFYGGRDCFVEVNSVPDNKLFCPKGCGGRCLIAVRAK